MKTMLFLSAALPAIALASPALAQHSGHDMAMPQPAPSPTPAPPASHDQHGAMEMPAAKPDAEPAQPMPSMQQMDMGDRPRAPTTPTPPPPEAGTGPARAADAIWGADAMRASRDELKHGLGGQTYAKVMVDRLEYRARDGADGYLWEGQAWYGGDIDKLWIRSEGEGTFGGEAEQAEVQALWSHAIGPWFDLQTGVRHDFAGPSRTHAVIGVQGLAPYQFETSAEAFLSDKGELTARIEGELDQRITQRLILQPRAELNLSAQDIPELGVGAGLDKAEAGLRLRYEFAREFAPYIGVAQEWRVGHGADFARARGDSVSTTNLVFGLRAWF
ncbi:copper resistance protein B, partial [Stakelama marina]